MQVLINKWALSQKPMRPKAEWAIDSEAMGVSGILSNPTSWPKMSRQNSFR